MGLAGCTVREAPNERHSSEGDVVGDRPIEPIPLTVEFDAARAALGEALFKEPKLSGDGKVACSDCHHEGHGLADPNPHSNVGSRPETGLNVPTMYNVGLLSKLSWGGKYDSLEGHIDGLMKNPKVMASSWEGATKRLSEVSRYRERFAALFRDGLTPPNLRQVILDYERSLITPNSPFDRFLRGDPESLSVEAKRGYTLFKSFGCSSCHQGVAIGGNVYERFGVLRDFFADRGHFDEADLGRFNVTAREQDRFVFRVPSLRNVALTAPYFHDGGAPTLEVAVATMARYQLGRELSSEARDDLVAFLRSLTGEYRGKPL